MKKLSYLLSGLLLTSALAAQVVNIQPGWQLLGATQDINTSGFDDAGCVDYLWKYNHTATTDAQKWQLHISNPSITSGTVTYPLINSLNAGDGYWVKGNSVCDVTTYTPTQSLNINNSTIAYSDVEGNVSLVFNQDKSFMLDWSDTDGTSGVCSGDWNFSTTNSQKVEFTCDGNDGTAYTDTGYYIFDNGLAYNASFTIYTSDDGLSTETIDSVSYSSSFNIKEFLADKTFYTTIYDINGTMESWEFNSDVTAGIWTELIGGSDSGTDTIMNVSGNSFYAIEAGNEANVDESDKVTIIDIFDDYFTATADGSILRLYFEQTKAEAYLDSFTAQIIPSKMISSTSDWNSVENIFTDVTGDADISGLDITSVKMSQDDDNLYINLEKAGLVFPATDYYYNYWIYFRAGNDTFSLENFHDNAGSHFYRIYKGIGYDGGTLVSEVTKFANKTSISLELVVPKSNLINTSINYQVTLFTHGFQDNQDDILGEKEEDSSFSVGF